MNMDKVMPYVIDCISTSINDLGVIDWFKASNPAYGDNIDEYNRVAKAIIEPYIQDAAASFWYMNFIDQDEDSWVGLIANNFGRDFDNFAKLVMEYGY